MTSVWSPGTAPLKARRSAKRCEPRPSHGTAHFPAEQHFGVEIERVQAAAGSRELRERFVDRNVSWVRWLVKLG